MSQLIPTGGFRWVTIKPNEIGELAKRTDKGYLLEVESIDLLKGRLKNQIMSFKETVAKLLNRDTSLAEKIQMLFRRQGIMIVSILTAIRMAISVLAEALLPDGWRRSIRW